MAKVQTGNWQEALTGKIGNRIYLKTKYGTCVKEYVKPKNPKTPEQQKHRKLFSETGKIMRGLSPEQIKSYKARAPRVGIQAWYKLAFNEIYTALRATYKEPPATP